MRKKTGGHHKVAAAFITNIISTTQTQHKQFPEEVGRERSLYQKYLNQNNPFTSKVTRENKKKKRKEKGKKYEMKKKGKKQKMETETKPIKEKQWRNDNLSIYGKYKYRNYIYYLLLPFKSTFGTFPSISDFGR